MALGNFARQTLGNGCFADAGIADQNRVVFAAAAQNLDAALNLMVAANQRINIALGRFFIEIDAIFCQSALFFGGLMGFAVKHFRLIFSANDWPAFDKVGIFGHPVGDEIHRIIAGHVLLLQEIGRVALAFGKYCDQNIGARHFCAP